MLKSLAILLGIWLSGAGLVTAQAPAPSAKPAEHLLGTISAVDQANHTITVKDDKSGTETVILVGDTRTLLKVAPGAKDLKTATRITADDLAVGDRVDVRGTKPAEDPAKIAARSVVLMSARDLQAAHEQQAAEWQRSTSGVVTAVDAGSGKLTVTVRRPDGPQPVTIETSKGTEFTRFAPEQPGAPARSQLSDIQAGDQVRVLGDKSQDGTTLTARKVYSGAFRTINGTVVAVDAAANSLTVKNLATKKAVEISVNERSSVHKLPPMLAMGLARRLNPGYRPSGGAGSPGAPSGAAAGSNGEAANAPADGARAGGPPGNSGGAGGMNRARGNGDISQMIDRLPKVSLSELKPGDAVVVSGVATGSDNNRLVATAVIAGVEPILQASPARGGSVAGGDWGLGDIAAPQ